MQLQMRQAPRQKQEPCQAQIITMLPQCRFGLVLIKINSFTLGTRRVRAKIADVFFDNDYETSGIVFQQGSLEYFNPDGRSWEMFPKDEFIGRGVGHTIPSRITFLSQKGILSPAMRTFQTSWGRTEILLFRPDYQTFTL